MMKAEMLGQDFRCPGRETLRVSSVWKWRARTLYQPVRHVSGVGVTSFNVV